jgi:hypothetical protein
MTLRDYFDTATGTGILATADKEGNVNAAIYSRPHFMEDESIAFIMADRRTHFNLQSNPKAVYLFRESGKGYRGSRLYLTKVREEKNSTLIQSLRRKPHAHTGGNDTEVRYLVYFRIDNVLPLVGSGSE